ncbi:MAG: four helix bundle protein [Elusimicrobiota bacterium]
MLKSYRELIVWQKSYQLVLLIYKTTMDFPKTEIYGLTSQMRRASVSIPSNIAEGYGRQYTGEYLQFLSIAFGSLAELETQVMVAKDLGYISQEGFVKVCSLQEEIGKMLSSLMKALRK